MEGRKLFFRSCFYPTGGVADVLRAAARCIRADGRPKVANAAGKTLLL